jgi:VWFA-related protein
MSVRSTVSCGAILVACLATLAVPPRAGGQKQLPAMSTASRVVKVSLVATGSNGAPVTDLSSDEIRITDNGKTQKIASFEKLKGDSAPVTPNGSAVYNVVVFDTMNATYLDQPRVRLELLNTLGELGSGDRTSVFMLHNGLRLLHDYNTETPALLRKLAQQRSAQPLPTSAEGLAAYSWVFDDIGPLNLFSPTTITESRWQDQTLEAITTLAAKMGRLQGRKNLIWIGTGLLVYREGIDQIPNRYLPPRTYAASSENPDLFKGQIEMAARALNNVDVAFYAVDARPFTLGNQVVTDMGVMSDLARMTGGVAYPDRNTVKSTLREALDDSREAYLLTYSPTGLKADGKYHEIEVRTSRGSNVKLRHRDGYNATNP